MANLSEVLQQLKGERNQAQEQLRRLDKAITVLRSVVENGSTGNNYVVQKAAVRNTLSAAARRKISRAQKARWAKVKQARKSKG